MVSSRFSCTYFRQQGFSNYCSLDMYQIVSEQVAKEKHKLVHGNTVLTASFSLTVATV
jgi:hypothetical protein